VPRERDRHRRDERVGAGAVGCVEFGGANGDGVTGMPVVSEVDLGKEDAVSGCYSCRCASWFSEQVIAQTSADSRWSIW